MTKLTENSLETSAEAFENILRVFSDENVKAEDIRAILDEALG